MVDIVGSELLPAIGGCFACGEGWLFFYPEGITRPGTNVQVPDVLGTAIAGTSWGRVLVATKAGVELWRPWDTSEAEASCVLPFEAHALLPMYGDLILAVSSDGLYSVLDVSDEINPTVEGTLEHARNVTGGYYHNGAEPLLVINGDLDAIYIYEQQTIYDTLAFVFQSRTVLDTLKDLAAYNLDAVQYPGGNDDFRATLDPQQDQTIKYSFERTSAVGIRYGFMAAHAGTGILSVFVDENAVDPPGVDFPFFPIANVRFDFRKAAGDTEFVDRDGTSSGTTVVPITQRQVIEDENAGMSGADEIVIDAINEPFTVPGAILIEHAQGIDLADTPLDRVVNLIEVGNPEFFRIEMSSDATLTVNEYEFYLNGSPMSVVAAANAPFASITPGQPANAYHLTLINFKQDSVDVWQDGVLLRSDPVTYSGGVIDTSVFKLLADITGSSAVFGSLSDLRLFINQAISDDQAKALSGGEITF